MARLDVSIATDPRDPSYVLASIEDAAGDPVQGLDVDNFEVSMWAATVFSPGTLPLTVPVSEVKAAFPPSYYQLHLGRIHTGEETGPGLPVSFFGASVFTVTVASGTDRGQALTCVCSEDAGSSRRPG